jgi:SPP1 gp7 family putative phage head morphogenesis protein
MDKVLLANEAMYERRVASVLRKALDEIRAEMGKIYEKYAVDGLITTADMTRYARYAAMETNILAKLEPAIKANLATMKRLTPAQYNAAFFRAAWRIDNETGIALNWGVINTDAIKAAYAITDPANKAMAEALRNYSMRARRVVRVAINDGLAQGKSYYDMMRNIREALNKTNYEAMRIIRTEGQSAVSAGTADAYDKALEDGVAGKVVWVSTLDERTRDQHRTMDGQERDEDGMFHFPNGEIAPYPCWEGLSAENRINCRCAIRMEIDGYSPQLRRSREGGVIPYQTYSDWERDNGPTVH